MHTYGFHQPATKLEAVSIIANPKPEHSASLRLLAWAALKAERGQIVRQHRVRLKAITSDRQVV